ncbi:MAG TPA: VOC family protein [Polyangia bacterium]|jgi:predicted 3-demethylubiquinone-9 3-methyltransferase (glyoxalase superfamily)
MSKITPFLWFDTQAEEAANYYVALFRNSKIRQVTRYPTGSPRPEGSVMTVAFSIEGQEFVALNGDRPFELTPAISFFVHCETQADIDRYWDRILADGGKEMACGWITDKFGIAWQIVPADIMQIIGNPDRAKAARAMAAMMTMIKLDADKLRNA